MMAHTAFDDDEEFGDEEDGVVTMEVAPSGESSTATGGGSGDEDTRELSFKDLEGELNGETASPAFVGHLHAAAGQRANEGEGASLMADGGGDDDDDRGGEESRIEKTAAQASGEVGGEKAPSTTTLVVALVSYSICAASLLVINKLTIKEVSVGGV